MSIVEFFNKSTQAMTKLKQNQTNSTVPEYEKQATALGVLQDVVTRWWSTFRSQYPILARLAREFLAIPATSAPSERVWSRAAQVLTHKRSKIKSTLSERIMFIRENSSLVHKHYAEIAKKWKDKKDHWIIAEEQKYLPPIYEAEELDVGQRDHLTLF